MLAINLFIYRYWYLMMHFNLLDKSALMLISLLDKGHSFICHMQTTVYSFRLSFFAFPQENDTMGVFSCFEIQESEIGFARKRVASMSS